MPSKQSPTTPGFGPTSAASSTRSAVTTRPSLTFGGRSISTRAESSSATTSAYHSWSWTARRGGRQLLGGTRAPARYAEVHANLGSPNEAGRPRGGRGLLPSRLALGADESVVSCHLGNALVALGEHDRAVDCYLRAAQGRPDFATAWFNLGRVLQVLGQHEQAAACYERAAQLRPDDPDPVGELASLMMSRGELDAAVAGYEEVLRLKPDSAAAYSNMGLALMALGRLEEARLSFGQALYLRPDLAEVHNNLGLAPLNEGRLAEAR